jgi:alkylated DNA nucleotide flippase Atl1
VTQDSFSKRVVKIALSIPKGKVTTYGRIAHAAGGGAIASQSMTSNLAKATTSGVRNIPYLGSDPSNAMRRFQIQNIS